MNCDPVLWSELPADLRSVPTVHAVSVIVKHIETPEGV